MEESELPSSSRSPGQLSLLDRLQYGLGSIGTGLYFSVPGILLLFYMTDVVGISAALAAFAIFLPKVVGAVADPLTGYLSDQTRSRWGRRFPWMALGTAVIVLCLALLFAGWFSGIQAFIFILTVYLLSSLAYSAYAVPYLTIPAEVTDDPVQRADLIAVRMICSMAGVLSGSALAPWLVETMGGGLYAYRTMGLIMALLAAIVLASACHFSLLWARDREDIPFAVGLRAQLGVAIAHENFRILVMIFVLQTIAASGFSAMVPYVVIRYWELGEGMVGLLMFSLLVASMAGMVFWSRIAARVGKAAALVFSIIAYALAVCAYFALPRAPEQDWLIATFALAGFCFAGTQLLPFAMVADEIHAIGHRSGTRSEGVFTGLWTACEKVGLSLGAPTAALVLALAGYVGGAEVQTEETLVFIFRGFLMIPILAQFASLALLIWHRAKGDALTLEQTGVEDL